MAWDKGGNLLPKMMVELIKDLQKLVDKNGDLPVWVEVEFEFGDSHPNGAGDEYLRVEAAPVSDAPTIKPTNNVWGAKDYWRGRFTKIVVIKAY